MTRDAAERITTEYMKPIYGFALKRCSSIQDAEDLTQEICLKVYRALLQREDLDSVRQFVWTAAHNALSNYYRGKHQTSMGVPIHDFIDDLPSEDDIAGCIAEKEAQFRLQSEIAYLSKLQRKILISYYYENQKQEEIAKRLNLPLGTVKWHLFEAKNDLRKGMASMRQSSELKFNPIRFELCGTNGSIGTKGANHNFFRSALSQNITYSVRNTAKTVNEIADDLGVSPVYVEDEADYLTEYGFLIKSGNKYVINILLDEPTDELLKLQNEMYGQAAKLIANALFDDLTGSGILNSDRIVCDQTNDPSSASGTEIRRDDNFILWSLIPYIAALSGEQPIEKSISFEDAMTVRPDGGRNICYASVLNSDVASPVYMQSMKSWCGPMWNASDNYTLWQIDTEWSEKRVDEHYPNTANRDLALLEHVMQNHTLSKEEYAILGERGYLKFTGDATCIPNAALQVVWIKDIETKQKLIGIGDRIKEEHKTVLNALKAPYIKAVLDSTPKHLQKMQGYGMQYIFYADGWFLLYCMKELVNHGKLKLPAEEQKKSLTTVIAPND